MRADFSLDYDVLTVERTQRLYLLARFVAGSSPQDAKRRPLNLSLVIDKSGSMAGAKMDYTRQSAQFLVQHLGSEDLLSVVLYNDRVETLFPPERVTNKDALVQLLDRVRVHGTTNLSGGWLEGCAHVANHHEPERLNRVILMSDGLANRGVTDVAQLVALARQKYEAGISTTTMGLGDDFNEDLMMEMANAGGGAFYFIESPEVAPEIFKEELTGLLSVVGQNLTITVTPTPHVSLIKQMNAYPMHTDGKEVTFKLGDVFGGEHKTLVLELSIPALRDMGEQQIALLRFEYDEIIDMRTQHHIVEHPIMVKVKGMGELPPPPNIEVIQSVLLLRAAQARQEAVKSADSGDYQTASQVLRAVASAIRDSVVKNEVLQEEEQALLAQANKMDSGAEAYDSYSRKTMSTQAYYSMRSRHEDTVVLRAREEKRAQSSDASSVGNTALPPTQEEIFAVSSKLEEAIPYQPGISPTHVMWKDKLFALDGDVMRIGRAVHNEIVIDERGVSRFHAHIRREGNTLIFEDLGSTNGSMVGGHRLKTPYRLSVGDVVYLCDEKLVFRLGKTGTLGNR